MKKMMKESSQQAKLRAKASPKRITVKKQATPIEKVKQFVKAKFKKAPDELNSKDSNEDQQEQKSKPSSSKGEALVSFFYTNDKFMNQFEDKDIIADIQKKYPKFMIDSSSDSELKKTVCEVIQDKKFVEQILESYDMTVLDFFKFVFRLDMGIFKGAFLTKISHIVNGVGYDVKFRK